MSHSPYTPPGVSSEGRSRKQVRRDYRETIRYADRFIEKIVDHFKSMGLYKNTVFVVVSDHGEGFGAHGLFGHNADLYEEGTRAALIIHDPRHPQRAGPVDRLSWHLDILPTIAEAAGFSIEQASYPGHSLLAPRQLPARSFVIHGWYVNRILARVDRHQKFIYHVGDRPPEVFDLTDDPGETAPIEIGSDRQRQRSQQILARRNRNLLRYERFYDGKSSQHVFGESADVSPEVEASAQLGEGVDLLGVDRPLAFGEARSRTVVVYAHVAKGSYPPGIRLALTVDGGPGEPVTKVFDLLDEPVELSRPATLARAISVERDYGQRMGDQFELVNPAADASLVQFGSWGRP